MTPRRVRALRLLRRPAELSVERMEVSCFGGQKRRGPAGPLRNSPGRALLFDIHPVERVAPERRELEIHDLLAHGLELHRVGDREPRRLLLEDDLRLSVELGALLLVARDLRLGDEVVERLVAPFRGIAAAGLRGVAAQQGVQEVVRIAVIAGPAEHAGLMLARLQALPVLAPLEALDLG